MVTVTTVAANSPNFSPGDPPPRSLPDGEEALFCVFFPLVVLAVCRVPTGVYRNRNQSSSSISSPCELDARNRPRPEKRTDSSRVQGSGCVGGLTRQTSALDDHLQTNDGQTLLRVLACRELCARC
ncbi:hypothetical protein DTO271G3_2645 [Paecilomyces variotii]|nr:hypothetical protein DTO271G3_2645 [Paecilomyces variotii]